jgi:hypothetical protein
MKLEFFDDFKLGVVAGDKVVDVTDVVKLVRILDLVGRDCRRGD